MDYVCSDCGAPAPQDELRDGPTLTCGCDQAVAKPVERYISEAEEWDAWVKGR